MKLYYEDAYLKKFTANVTGCERQNDKYAVTLDRTAFYPEGGGQPFDTGTIDSAKVLEVRERGGEILHYTQTPVAVGRAANCAVDWDRRFRFMQEHTGEHILSGIIKSTFGLNNIGFHMGSEFVTIDIDGELSDGQLLDAEKRGNAAIYQNIAVDAGFKAKEELDCIQYRHKGQIAGDVRIVRIGEYDVCACCGIHCRFTGEIGLLKIIGAQKYKQGQRIFLLCGSRAFDDYSAKSRSVRDISVMLSAKQDEVSSAVKQLQNENANIKNSLYIFKERVFSEIANKIPENSRQICIFEDGLTSDELRRLCLLIAEKAVIAAVFSASSSTRNEYKYAIASKSGDVREITAKLNAAFSGRGGGKKELNQGSLSGKEEEISRFFSSLS